MSVLRRCAFLCIVAIVLAACGSGAATTTTESVSTTSASTSPDTTESSAIASTTSSGGTTSSSAAPDQIIQVYFATGDGTDCAEVTGFARTIASDLDPVLTAYELLVAGPTVEEMNAGASSFFSDESAGALETSSLADGYLVVSFRDVRQLLSNASTSCGSQSFLAQLNATAFQFDQVERVRYEIEGSCGTFAAWLQRECEEYTREGPQPPPTTDDRASGSGCTPGSDELPNGHWFGFVDSADGSDLSFDLACWFTGSAAVDAAAEDGEESPPPNDYYVRNQNEQLRQVPVSPDAMVECLCDDTDTTQLISMTYAEWLDEREAREYQPGVWIEVTEGVIGLITEQYVP